MEKEIKPLLPYDPDIDEKTAMEEELKVWAYSNDRMFTDLVTAAEKSNLKQIKIINRIQKLRR